MDNILRTDIIDNQQPRFFNYYGYVYITTNIINNKKYVGAHKGSKLDKNYKGSGVVLARAIEKYGEDNFSVQILEWCETREKLFRREYEIIKELDCVRSDDYYNVRDGGLGGTMKYSVSSERYEEIKQKISNSRKNSKLSDKQKEQLYRLHKSNVGRNVSEESRQKARQSNLGQKRSEECKKHLKEASRRRFNNNSGTCLGRKAVNKDGIQKFVLINELDEYLSDGWKLGSKPNIVRKDTSGVNNPNYGKHLSDEAKKSISIANSTKGKSKVWITNKEDTELLITRDELKNYPDFVKGRLRKRQKHNNKE